MIFGAFVHFMKLKLNTGLWTPLPPSCKTKIYLIHILTSVFFFAHLISHCHTNLQSVVNNSILLKLLICKKNDKIGSCELLLEVRVVNMMQAYLFDTEFRAEFFVQDAEKREEAELLFTKLKKCYEVLSDPHKRAIYDSLGQEGLKVTGYLHLE